MQYIVLEAIVMYKATYREISLTVRCTGCLKTIDESFALQTTSCAHETRAQTSEKTSAWQMEGKQVGISFCCWSHVNHRSTQDKGYHYIQIKSESTNWGHCKKLHNTCHVCLHEFTRICDKFVPRIHACVSANFRSLWWEVFTLNDVLPACFRCPVASIPTVVWFYHSSSVHF